MKGSLLTSLTETSRTTLTLAPSAQTSQTSARTQPCSRRMANSQISGHGIWAARRHTISPCHRTLLETHLSPPFSSASSLQARLDGAVSLFPSPCGVFWFSCTEVTWSIQLMRTSLIWICLGPMMWFPGFEEGICLCEGFTGLP